MAATTRRTSEAVAETAALRVAGEAKLPPAAAGPLLGDLRRGGLLPLLVLHFVAREPSYGNQLMERIAQLTAGAVAVNPNTMYPLLRSLEERGLIAGAWEHPERRTRRFYRITPDGEAERTALAAALEPRLDAVSRGVDLIRRELADSAPPAPGAT
jgi:PadR family transcriptional regulator, regulatory protein PadR